MSNKLKSIFLVSFLIISLLLSVMAWVFADDADKRFWWTFWDVIKAVAPACFIGGVFWFGKSRKQW